MISSEEQNSCADSAKSNNGGGYFQPHTVYAIEGTDFTLDVNDTSCGEFGMRIVKTLLQAGKPAAKHVFNTMDNEPCDKYYWFSLGYNSWVEGRDSAGWMRHETGYSIEPYGEYSTLYNERGIELLQMVEEQLYINNKEYLWTVR
jgi:hypothetical protein